MNSAQKKEAIATLLQAGEKELANALAGNAVAGPNSAPSKVKKKMAPHMWVISKDNTGAYIVSIGDPKKSGSKLKKRFTDKNELKYWAKYDIGREVSPDHVIDLTGLKLVPDTYSQWYVDNMMGKGKASTTALVVVADTNKLERLVSGMEQAAKEARDALNKYKKDPQKFAPQLKNLSTNFAQAQSLGRVGMRILQKIGGSTVTAQTSGKELMVELMKLVKKPKDRVRWMVFLGRLEEYFDQNGGADSTQQFSTIKRNAARGAKPPAPTE